MNYLVRHGKKIIVAFAGGIVTLAGLVLIPYPGPGWLVVFAGLAILSTEFEFAARWLAWLKGKYELWAQWLKRQPRIIQALVLVCTGIVVIVTLWLLNTFGLIDNALHLHWNWLHTPFLKHDLG